ncbi:hypothetical protein ACFO9E_08115, partial [Streptomyces maoxianensis]
MNRTPSLFASAVYEKLLGSVPRGGAGRLAWHVADPYVLRHAAHHASKAGRVNELLEDPDFLVHGEPDGVHSVLHEATTDHARLSAAVYRASFALHRSLSSAQRRQVLALDSARFQARALSAEFARGTGWRPRWATGSQVSASSTAVLSGHAHAWGVMALTTVDGRRVAVTGNGDNTLRVWDLATGLASLTLSGHGDVVTAVAATEVRGQPVALSASRDTTVRVWNLLTGQTTA